MDAHADAVARARAIAARLAGVPASADLGGGTTAAATQPPAAAAAPAPAANAAAAAMNADVQAMLDAALGGGGGGGASAVNTAATVPTATSTSSKRGVEDALASLIPGLGHSDSNKRARTDAGAASDGGRAVKKIWIPSDKNPGYNYVGLLIGPGGSKQRELVAQSGGQVKISIRGKGSSQKMDSVPGMPDEPLHVLLEGSQECVDKAEVLVRELLENSEAADKEKARQLGIVNEGGDGKSASTSSSSYTPKPVAQILGQMAGSTPLSAYGSAEQQVEEKIGVPNGVVGYIIGRGGESITSMQRRTGCRVQIQKEHEMAPGTAQRVITLTAPTAESIAQCRGIIEEMVKERLAATASTSGATGGMMGGGVGAAGPGSNATAQMAQLQKALAEGQQHVTVQVPDADVGLIIGKGGAQIRTIQESSGANVQIPQVADANNPAVRTVNITHPNKEGAEFAKQMIQEILNTKLQQQQQQHGGGGGDQTTIQVNCPDKDVGMIIGRGGCVIKQMQSQTRCRIQIPPTAPPGSMYRVISVSGPAAGCEQVKQMIETIVQEQSSQSVMSGVAFGNSGNHYGQQQSYGQQNYYGQQQTYGQQGGYQQQQAYGQGQQQAGQKDYSAEWAAYYAAQAAAQQGGQAAGAASATSAPAPAAAASDSAQPAHDAYYDVFWQYASYYGEEAARKHYGGWSPPVGTPNPNAAAAGAGATQAAAPTPATAAPAAAQQTAQDSSVRKVSNLPAWMTKKDS